MYHNVYIRFITYYSIMLQNIFIIVQYKQNVPMFIIF